MTLPKNVRDALPNQPGEPVGPVTPGTGATDLGKAEDAPAASGDTGVAVWGVRNDAGTVMAGDGDYIPFSMDASGNLRTSIGAVVPGTGATNLGKAEDSPHTTGDVGVEMLGVRNDAGTAFGADGDYVPLSIDASGALRTAIASVMPGTGATNLGKAEDAPHTTGDVGVEMLAVRNDAGTAFGADGDYVPLSINAAGALRVSSDVTAVVPGVGATQLGKAEDAVHASGDTGVMVLGVRSDASGTFGAAGDYVPLSIDGFGAVRVLLMSGGGDPLDGGTGVIPVDITTSIPLTVTQEITGGIATYTAAANSVSGIAVAAVKYHSLQVTATGAVTSWTVVLEGSLDGTTFTTILTHTNATGSGVTVTAAPPPFLCRVTRTRCVAIVLGAGTNVVARYLSST